MQVRLQHLTYIPFLTLAMAFMFARVVLMVRILNVLEFGRYSEGLLISSTFCMLACLGLQTMLQRDMPVMLVRSRVRRYRDAEIELTYPRNRILEICGPAGTGFAENTLCIHKGQSPTSEDRLILQLQFALFDYGVMHDRRDSALLGFID
jgi:hypothetical protein